MFRTTGGKYPSATIRHLDGYGRMDAMRVDMFKQMIRRTVGTIKRHHDRNFHEQQEFGVSLQIGKGNRNTKYPPPVGIVVTGVGVTVTRQHTAGGLLGKNTYGQKQKHPDRRDTTATSEPLAWLYWSG